MTDQEGKVVHIDELLTPIFSPEIGARMRVVRMKWLIDQKDMSKEFDITQQHYSRLERGHIKHFDITLNRFKEIFKEATLFVLKGTNAERWELTRKELIEWERKKYKKQLGKKKSGCSVRGLRIENEG